MGNISTSQLLTSTEQDRVRMEMSCLALPYIQCTANDGYLTYSSCLYHTIYTFRIQMDVGHEPFFQFFFLCREHLVFSETSSVQSLSRMPMQAIGCLAGRALFSCVLFATILYYHVTALLLVLLNAGRLSICCCMLVALPPIARDVVCSR